MTEENQTQDETIVDQAIESSEGATLSDEDAELAELERQIAALEAAEQPVVEAPVEPQSELGGDPTMTPEQVTSSIAEFVATSTSVTDNSDEAADNQGESDDGLVDHWEPETIASGDVGDLNALFDNVPGTDTESHQEGDETNRDYLEEWTSVNEVQDEAVQSDQVEPEPVQDPVAAVEEPAAIVFDKPLASWTLDEVRAVIAGDLPRPANVTERDVVERGRSFAYRVDPDHAMWSFREVFTWLKTNELPKTTSGGFYLSDPTRLAKKAHEWADGELIDYLKGELSATLVAPEEELMEAVSIMWKLPAEWSDDEVTDYVLFNRQPQKSPSGFWINDRVRMRKPAHYWTLRELLAFVRGEIPATTVASEEALYNTIRERFDVSESYTQERLLQLLADYKEEPLSMALQFVKHNLDTYAAGMGKGVMVNEDGAAGFQILLHNTISRVLRLDGREFVDGWTMILDFVNAHRTTMFAEHNSYRGIAKVKLSTRERGNFEQLLNLVIKTSNPTQRYAQAQKTNFEVALNGIADEAVRQRVLAYYQVNQ